MPIFQTNLCHCPNAFVACKPNMVVFDSHEYLTDEERRLKEDRTRAKYWKKWGSYVAERQWATGQLLLPAS